MKRREFIAGLGSTVAWPIIAKAQPAERMRRVAILMDLAEHDASRLRLTAFVQGLVDLGWNDGHNLKIDIRWGANDSEKSRILTAELLALDPDVVLASASSATSAMRQAS